MVPARRRLANYTKVDLIDLIERSVRGERLHPRSGDDGGAIAPGAFELHTVCSLSKSEHTMSASRAYGDDGHAGETWTLARIGDCGGQALTSSVFARTYKYVHAAAGSPTAFDEASGQLERLRTVEFNGARERATKASAAGIAQSWSVLHLDESRRARNTAVLDQVAAVLRRYPELVCEVHGTTTTPRACDADLAAHFGYDPQAQMRQAMDALARERARSCLEALIGRGIERRRLRVTYQGCAGESRVHFIAREVFAPRYDLLDETEALFSRYDRDASGHMDVAELKEALNALGLQADSDGAARVLNRFDRDASGRLEFTEFKRLVVDLRAFLALPPGRRSPSTRRRRRRRRHTRTSGMVTATPTSMRRRPPPPPPPPAKAETVGDVFRRFDKDNSKTIDLAELRDALNQLGLPVETEGASRVLAKYDKDQSGQLDIGEFRTLVRELKKFQGEKPPS